MRLVARRRTKRRCRHAWELSHQENIFGTTKWLVEESCRCGAARTKQRLHPRCTRCRSAAHPARADDRGARQVLTHKSRHWYHPPEVEPQTRTLVAHRCEHKGCGRLHVLPLYHEDRRAR